MTPLGQAKYYELSTYKTPIITKIVEFTLHHNMLVSVSCMHTPSLHAVSDITRNFSGYPFVHHRMYLQPKCYDIYCFVSHLEKETIICGMKLQSALSNNISLQNMVTSGGCNKITMEPEGRN